MARAQQSPSIHTTPPSHSRFQSASKDIMLPRLMVILSVLGLVVIGLVMVFSASSVTAYVEQGDAYGETIHQVIFAALGTIVCLGVIVFVKKMGIDALASNIIVYGFWAICLVGVVLTEAIGTESLGAKRWLVIGGISIQIAEFLKISLVFMAARIMIDYNNGASALNVIIRSAVFIIAPLLLMFVLQSDFGTSVICLIAIFVIFVLGGLPAKWILAIAAMVLVLGCAAVFSTPYRAARVLSFLDPWGNIDGDGYQIVHSLQALASGGLSGVGLGNSYEKLQYLPEAETDFIFAIIGEENGLIGTIFVVFLFLVFLYGSYWIARNSSSSYGMLVVGALATMLVAQAFINILCVIGLFPITGKPLPFISSGGSSLVSSLLIVGIILAVSFASEPAEDHYQQRRDRLHVVSSYGSGAGNKSNTRH